MINPYFNQTTFATEQNLVADLIDESIQIYGHNVYYLPRSEGNIDAFLGEDPLANFQDAIEVEMYVKSYEAFTGQSEFISKFGLHIEDQITLVVSQRRFANTVTAGDATIVRPRENDLIYIQMTPTNRYLFEIRFVENKEELFQLGKLYTYELRCEMMNFTNEVVNTGNTDVDAVASRDAYTIALVMNAGGNGTFTIGETAYQGANLASATATGEVYQWTANTRTLLVQQITGTFANVTTVRGANSNAAWVVSNTTPNTAPTIHDPISDNEFLQGNPLGVVVTRGTHMLDD